MPQLRTRRTVGGVMLVALALSIIIHIIGAIAFAYYHPTEPVARREVQRVTLNTIIRHRKPPPTPVPTLPPTPPPPTPTPPPQPTPTPVPATPQPHVAPPTAPKQAAPAHLHVKTPHAVSHAAHSATEAHGDTMPGTQSGAIGGNGTGTGTGNLPGPPNPPARPAPPAPTAAACAIPNSQPKPTNAVQSDQPEEAQGATGTVKVQVSLSATGTVTTAAVSQSSGNPFLDRAAIAAARQSTYQPERRDCVNVPGDYIFRVEFTGE